jgi:hypothetical protein
LEAVHQALQDHADVEFGSDIVNDILDDMMEPFRQPLEDHYGGSRGVGIAFDVATILTSIPLVFWSILTNGEANFLSALQPRLDHDQACYELIRHQYREDGPINESFNAACTFVESPWASLSNIFDPPTQGSHVEYLNSARVWAAELMLKVKALLNLRDLERTVILGAKVPFEVLTMVREELAMPLVRANAAFMLCLRRGDSLEPWASKLRDHVRDLYHSIGLEDRGYWRMFQDWARDLAPSLEDFGRLLNRAVSGDEFAIGSRFSKIELIFPIIRDTPEVVDWVLNYIE